MNQKDYKARNDMYEIAAEKILLERRLFKQRYHIVNANMESARWECPDRDEAIEQLTYAIYSVIDDNEKDVISYPSDWLEALKERWAPAWLRDIYPVKFTQVAVSFTESYPDFTPSLGGNWDPFIKFDVIRKRNFTPIW